MLALNLFFLFTLRYMNHLQSLKFESKLYAMVKEKMEEMQQHNMSWIEVTLHNLFHSTHYTKNKDTYAFFFMSGAESGPVHENNIRSYA